MTRRRARRSGSREFCMGIDLAMFRRGWRIRKLIDLLQGMRGRRGAAAKNGRQRGIDHLGDVGRDDGRGRGASGGPRVPRRIRLWVRLRCLRRIGRLRWEGTGWTSRAMEFALELAQGAQVTSGTARGSNGPDTSNGVFGHKYSLLLLITMQTMLGDLR